MTKAREPAAPALDTAPTRSAGATPPEEELSFEQILERLEAVVETLERGDRPLEEALASFEQGVALSRRGARRLDDAERRIEVLLNDDNGTRTRPLDKDKELTGNE